VSLQQTLNLEDPNTFVGQSWPLQVDRFPATRFQGSKRKLLKHLGRVFETLPFDSALDLYAGTGSVSYLLKAMGKQVTANDYLAVSTIWAEALVVNNSCVLSPHRLVELSRPRSGRTYSRTIAEHYDGLFFLSSEDEWLDVTLQNIDAELEGTERSLALFAVTQAALVKRPYNLFHRANLYMRTADVKRSFGNQTSWNRSFDEWSQRLLAEANLAVFDSGRSHVALNEDATSVTGRFDLVYLDPPYLNQRGVGVDYNDFYHFLEGMVRYPEWHHNIDSRRRHKPFAPRRSKWSNEACALDQFASVLRNHPTSIFVISYRDDGKPSIGELRRLLSDTGREVVTSHGTAYQYALSPNRSVKEELLVAR
jgi:adenine-specific DNA-methyltransferase